jgi:hypothetical protein
MRPGLPLIDQGFHSDIFVEEDTTCHYSLRTVSLFITVRDCN